MNTPFQPTSGASSSSFKFARNRLSSRLDRKIIRGISTRSAARFDSSLSLYNSLWSPVRLDLLKAPLTRHRE